MHIALTIAIQIYIYIHFKERKNINALDMRCLLFRASLAFFLTVLLRVKAFAAEG